jgi:hypothetical protein
VPRLKKRERFKTRQEFSPGARSEEELTHFRHHHPAMGIIESSLHDEKSLISVGFEPLLDQSFVHEKYQTSPLRAHLDDVSTDRTQSSTSLTSNLEDFQLLLSRYISSDDFGKALVAKNPSFSHFSKFYRMRTELLARIGFQMRKEMEEKVRPFFCFVSLALGCPFEFGSFCRLPSQSK